MASQPQSAETGEAVQSDEQDDDFDYCLLFPGDYPTNRSTRRVFDDYFSSSDGEDILSTTYDDWAAIGDDVAHELVYDGAGGKYLHQLTNWARKNGYDNVTLDSDIPNETRIEKIRSEDIGSIVSLEVRCTDRTEVYETVRRAKFQCKECGHMYDRMQSRSSGQDTSIDKCKCSECDAGIRSQEYKQSMSYDWHVDTQQAIVQDMHSLADTANPHDMKANLYGPFVGSIESGDTLSLNCLVCVEETEEKQADLYLQVVGVEYTEREYAEVIVSDDEIEEFEELAEDPEVYDTIATSVGSQIKGDYTLARRALLYQMFGGVSRGPQHRGDIHVAFVGDSGTGKTKLARGTVDVTPTSQYKSADNCTVAGLTAAATHEDRFDTSKWTLTGGALVRADGGHAVIDEIDKAGDEVQDSLQETLSEQQVSVSKASIDATLPARCSVMLVANPSNGRFDVSRPLDKQIDIKPAIWSRLDIIVPFVDKKDEEQDEAVAEGILNRAQEDGTEYLDEEFLTKYVSYARRIDPMITDDAREHLKETYSKMRSKSVGDRVAVGPRQFEGMIRIAEASARVRLSEKAELEDAKRATEIMDTWMSMLMTDNTGAFSVDAFHEEVEERSEVNALWRSVEELEDSDGADRQAVQEVMEERYDVEEAYQVVNKYVGSEDLKQTEDEDGNKILTDQR